MNPLLDGHYTCRKCHQAFNYQYHIMLHNRYFCSLLANNFFLRSVVDTTMSHAAMLRKEKRKPCDQYDLNGKKSKLTNNTDQVDQYSPASMVGYSHEFMTHMNQANNNKLDQLNEKYYENLLANFFTRDVASSTNFGGSYSLASSNNELIRSVLNMYAQQMSCYMNSKSIINSNPDQYKTSIVSQNNQIHVNNRNNNNNNNNNTNNILHSAGSNSVMEPNRTVVSSSSSKKQHSTQANNKQATNASKPASHCNSNELNQMINTQTLQNWCAKCNTHFRLTTDLVFHMRTYHRTNRKDDNLTAVLAPESAAAAGSHPVENNEKEATPAALGATLCHKLTDLKSEASKNSSEQHQKSKYLKCEICHEVFKEKHHLSRHMTSHR